MSFAEPMKIQTTLSKATEDAPPFNPLSPTLQRMAWGHGVPPCDSASAVPVMPRNDFVRPPPGLEGICQAPPSLLASRRMAQHSEPMHESQDLKPKPSHNKMEAPKRTPSPQGQAATPAPVATPELLTTVMVRNIPSEYTRKMFLDLVDSAGFAGCYDMVYLPINHRKGTAFGYAFVNLVTTEAAESLMARFNGFTAWQVESDKICEVSWSNALQGLQAHIERYRDSPMMKAGVPDEFKPALFSRGRRIAFPGPSRGVRAPRQGKPAKDKATTGVKAPLSAAPEARKLYGHAWEFQPLPGAVILTF